MRNLVIKIKLSKKLEGTMSENEKDDDIFSEKEKQVEIDPNPLTATLDELNDLLEKEKQKSLRLLADYQNLEKQTIDRINKLFTARTLLFWPSIISSWLN